MKYIKELIIVGLFVWIALLFTCNGGGGNNPIPIVKNTTRVDSFYVTTTRIDTFDTTIYVPMVSVPLVDTVYAYMDITTHSYASEDSLLSYKIEVDSECYPEDVRISYDLKQFTIKQFTHDSIYIRDSTNVKEVVRKSYLSAGAMLSGNDNSFGFAPMLSYNHKKGSSYLVGYDLLNKSVMVGFTKKISFK